MLDAAGRDYERRAVRSQNQAGLGSAGVILLLLVAFVIYFRRAARARAVAAGLAQENQRLLAASREEALTDALTGLGNRRALVADLETRCSAASDERPTACSRSSTSTASSSTTTASGIRPATRCSSAWPSA